LVIGSRCVAVIDTGGSFAEGQALDHAISKLTDVPVCFVLNTHVHPDHMLGNEAFRRDDVQFIGHENLPRAMALRGDTYLQRAAEYSGKAAEGSQIVLPEQTVAGEVQLDLGQRTLLLRAHATAHTDNDLSILDVQTGTLFTGDLVFLEHLPVLDGSINGWLGELDRLMGEQFERVVPGHGPVRASWPQGAKPAVRYLTELREATRDWIARGGELGKAQEGIGVAQPEQWQLIEQYHKRNVAAAFAELEWED
jgi:quinoprotein relay system zinc metallohydrolase 2